MSSPQRTLAMIKPDAMARGIAGKIVQQIEDAGFDIAALRLLRLSRELTARFYAVHEGKPFYEGLLDFMSGGPTLVMVLEGENVVERWREMLGDTDPALAAEGTIRRLYGTAANRNVAHGSDSAATAEREIAFFFAASELPS